jgi:hypothetical protein
MTIEWRMLTVEQLPAVASWLLPLYDKAIAHSKGDWTLEDALRLFVNSQHLLYLLYDNGCVIAFIQGQFVYYPQRTVFLVTLAAGKLLQYADSIKTLESTVAAQGAVEIEAWCRPSMERLLRRMGFKHKYNVVRKPIR